MDPNGITVQDRLQRGLEEYRYRGEATSPLDHRNEAHVPPRLSTLSITGDGLAADVRAAA